VAFVSSTDTLYAYSKEGPDLATALTTALMGCVFDAAQAAARRSPGRRLPTPLVAVLDEAANICKLAELPQAVLPLREPSPGSAVRSVDQTRSLGSMPSRDGW
jgi:hypothetical protein